MDAIVGSSGGANVEMREREEWRGDSSTLMRRCWFPTISLSGLMQIHYRPRPKTPSPNDEMVTTRHEENLRMKKHKASFKWRALQSPGLLTVGPVRIGFPVIISDPIWP